jgi:hypothetical protein
VPLKVSHILASEVSQPRSLYYRSRQSLPSPRKPNHTPDLYPLIANHNRNPPQDPNHHPNGHTPAQLLAIKLAAEEQRKKKLAEEVSATKATLAAVELAQSQAVMSAFSRSDSRTIRSELDRVPTLEMTAGRPHGVEKPMPQLLAPPPSLVYICVCVCVFFFFFF